MENDTENKNVGIDTLLNRTDVYHLMEPLLSEKARKIMGTKIYNSDLTWNRLSGYKTADGSSELLTMGIMTTKSSLDRAIEHMVTELNKLADLDLWSSTLSGPATIDLVSNLPFSEEIVLTCFIIVPESQVTYIRSIVKSYYEEGSELHSLPNNP